MFDIDVSKINEPPSHREVVWLNDRVKLGFLGVPKCSSSGIRQQFNLTRMVKYKDVPENYTVFTVVREPVGRFISAYIEVMQDCKGYPGGRFRHNIPRTWRNYNIYETLDRLQKSKLNPYEKFVAYLEKIEKELFFYEPHCTPMVYYVTDQNNEIQKNLKIFKMEEMSKLEEFLHSPVKKMNICENNTLKQMLREFVKINPELQARIEALYAQDVLFYKGLSSSSSSNETV